MAGTRLRPGRKRPGRVAVITPVHPNIGAFGYPSKSMADQAGMSVGQPFAHLDFLLAGGGAADDTAAGNP